MKKNITMNLFGTLYSIDEDAYDLLNSYLDNMKRYFSHKEGGEEIADDIEHRMAELMNELKSQGVEAINIEHVKGIIERIGSPEEMDGEEVADTSGSNDEPKGHKGRDWFSQYFSNKSRRKLFRDPDDRILGGTLSGIAYYLNVDVIWIRLLILLLAWFSFGTIFIVYLILWVIVPMAETPEDRLLMRGIPVNMENMRQEIMNENNRQETNTYSRSCSRPRSKLNLMVKIIFVGLLGLMLLPIGILLSFILMVLITCLFAVMSGTIEFILPSFGSYPVLNLLISGDGQSFIYWIAVIALITLLSLTLYGGIHFIMRLSGRAKPMTTSQRQTFLICWMACLIITIASFVHGGIAYETARSQKWRKEAQERELAQLREDSTYLAENGWKVTEHQNSRYYLYSGEYYTGNKKKRYIDSHAQEGLKFGVEKTVKVDPGIYRLRAVVRADGEGSEVFAVSGGKRLSVPIPPHGNIGGNVWADAVASVEKGNTDSDVLLVSQANNSQGFGWNEVIIEQIAVKDSLVKYGVTNNVPTKEWMGTWLSATDFLLEKVK